MPDERPEVATLEPAAIVRDLLRRKGNELDLEAQRLRVERETIDRQFDEIDQRRDVINIAYGLPDDVLERLVAEVGAALHPEGRAEGARHVQ